MVSRVLLGVFVCCFLLLINVYITHRRVSGDPALLTPAGTKPEVTCAMWNRTSVGFSESVSLVSACGEQQPPVQMPPSSKASNIYFLKIHKSGSTTFCNILWRFAWRHNLRVATYRKSPYESNAPDSILRFIIPVFTKGKSNRFNFFTEHSVYAPKMIRKVMEEPLMYVAFIRNPVGWLESKIISLLYHKVLHLPKDRLAESFTNLLDDPKTWKSPQKKRLVMSLRNHNTHMFGLNASRYKEKDFLDEVDKVFLVGITEYYDESLVMLRRKLNWCLQDMLYLRLRLHEYQRHPVTQHDKIYQRLCRWSASDCLLYQHFNRTFWARLRSEGPSLSREVSYFKRALRRVADFCLPFFQQLHLGNTSTLLSTAPDLFKTC